MIKKYFKTLLYLAVFVFLAQTVFALNIVELSPGYYPNTSRGRPLATADIYVGIPDLDPSVVANQKTLSVQQEDGTIVAVTQPIHTNAGGVPEYLGSPVVLLVEGDYSLMVLDKDGVQIYYVPSTAYEQYLVAGNYYYPDYSEADQGVVAVGSGNTVTDILTTVGAVENATIYFSHNSGANTTTYTFTTNTTITKNYNLILEDGVILDGAGDLAIYDYDQITAQLDQYIFGPSITLSFTKGGDFRPERWAVNTTPGTTDMTTAIQTVVSLAGITVASGVLGNGARVSLNGTYNITSPILMIHDGVWVVGSGKNSTKIINNTTNDYTFKIGSATPTTAKLRGCGIKDMVMDYNSADPTAGAHILVDYVKKITLDNLHLRDHFRGIEILGVDEGVRVTDCDIEQGTNTSAVQAGSAGIFIGRREVTVADGNSVLDAADGKYYVEPNSVYISNANILSISSGFGYQDGLSIDSCDGIYISNSHIQGGTRSAVDIHAVQANLGLGNIIATGVFVDDVNTTYGIYYRNNAALLTNLVQYHTWSGLTVRGFDSIGILIDEDVNDIVFDGGCVRGSGSEGIYIQDGDGYTISDFYFVGNNGDVGTKSNIKITDANNISIATCTFNGGYRGIFLNGATDQVTIQGCEFRNQTDTTEHDSLYLGQTGVDVKISNCTSDLTDVVASAADILLSPEHDVINVTGTDGIANIDANAETGGNSGFKDRVVTLTFADALTFTDGGNLKLAGNFTTSAEDSITLGFRAGNWYEISRSAN